MNLLTLAEVRERLSLIVSFPRGIKRFLWVHSFIDPGSECAESASGYGCGIVDVHSRSINDYKTGIPFISRLFRSAGPSAIIRLIISVVILSFNGHSWRTFSHVGNKINWVHPSLTNGDSSSSVILVIEGCFLKASGFHGQPYSIGPRVVKTVSNWTNPKTPARFNTSIHEVEGGNNRLPTAFANAFPFPAEHFPVIYSHALGGKLVSFPSSDVFVLGHSQYVASPKS